jgi:hypothetical protein
MFLIEHSAQHSMIEADPVEHSAQLPASPKVCQIHEVDGFGQQTWNIALNPGHWDKLF